MRHFVGLAEMPAAGADFFLLDRQVLKAFRQFNEGNTSIINLILWMGFKQESVTYEKQARTLGVSSWTLEKKLKLVVDSITAFTYRPIRFMAYAGFLVALVGFLYAGFLIVNTFAGHPVLGWTSLIVVVLLLGGFQMIMMGVLGEYLWRALDESRRRPRFLVESAVGQTRRQRNPRQF
jgi:dolichol-phosphate mannosyltransferase